MSLGVGLGVPDILVRPLAVDALQALKDLLGPSGYLWVADDLPIGAAGTWTDQIQGATATPSGTLTVGLNGTTGRREILGDGTSEFYNLDAKITMAAGFLRIVVAYFDGAGADRQGFTGTADGANRWHGRNANDAIYGRTNSGSSTIFSVVALGALLPDAWAIYTFGRDGSNDHHVTTNKVDKTAVPPINTSGNAEVDILMKDLQPAFWGPGGFACIAMMPSYPSAANRDAIVDELNTYYGGIY